MKKTKKSFTLIELLVVIAIIGLLSTVVLVSLQGVRARARDARRLSDIKQMQIALEQYYNDKGYYPYTVVCSVATQSGYVLDNNTTVYSPNGIVLSWTNLETHLSPYLKLPKDPGNFNYRYSATPSDYKIEVALESDTRGASDGGCYTNYEVWSGDKMTGGRWTCDFNMCIGW